MHIIFVSSIMGMHRLICIKVINKQLWNWQRMMNYFMSQN